MTTFIETTRTYQQGARTLPGRYYTSPEVFAEESEWIFRRSWLCVSRASELPKPGSYFLASVAGESVIVLRDDAGISRAFYNV
ncbi:MAG: aromatic ring-hydroxylating dioxygenase subunit alpha, partial [Gemmatimonadota bacterium]